jgi:hypothetical protein
MILRKKNKTKTNLTKSISIFKVDECVGRYSTRLLQVSIVLPVPTYRIHCKKRLLIFPSSAGMSLTKLSLTGNAKGHT